MKTWVAARDVPRILSLSLGYMATALVPRKLDAGVAGLLAEGAMVFNGRRIRLLARAVELHLGMNLNGRDPIAIAEEHYRMRIEDGWGRLRGLHAKGWQPRIEVDGIGHLRRALEAGFGVILWTTRFCGSVIPKAALWNSGIPVNHLSRAGHGAPSHSFLSLRVLAPLYARPEVRYLKRRVLVPLDESLGYMKELIAILKAGECLSISGDLSGRQNVCVPLLNGRRVFATGAPALAWRHHSALLAMHTLRTGRMAYRVEIAPVEVEFDQPRREFVRIAIKEFARQLEQRIIRHPADWQDWHEMI